MELTAWLPENGYHECFASFTKSSSPCLKLRVKKQRDETYAPVLKCYSSGEVMAHCSFSDPDIEKAKLLAFEFLKEFLIIKGKEITFKVNQNV